MKRLHVHVSIKDLSASIRFYRTLFGAEPVVTQPDYAKWMLDGPRVNFAISMNRQPVGVNHLGVQVESDEELRGMRARLEEADARTANPPRRWQRQPPDAAYPLSEPSLPVAAQNERSADLQRVLCGSATPCYSGF